MSHGLVPQSEQAQAEFIVGETSPSKNSEECSLFNIQRFSLHDGPGIRTTVFFKGCPLRCIWCQNPESHRMTPQLAVYVERCQKCGACETVCPAEAARPMAGKLVLFDRCAQCGACARICQSGARVMLGEEMSSETLERELLRDKDFYEDSGGGVTLSGGEPLLHADFLVSLLPRLKILGLHVLLETSGCASRSKIEPLLPFLDTIFYDLKLIDGERHRAVTGRHNSGILENFIWLTGNHPDMQPRMPCIPGINDQPEHIAAMAAFLRGCGHQTLICLPYHRLGTSKWQRLHDAALPFSAEPHRDNELAAIIELFRQEGIHAIIEG